MEDDSHIPRVENENFQSRDIGTFVGGSPVPQNNYLGSNNLIQISNKFGITFFGKGKSLVVSLVDNIAKAALASGDLGEQFSSTTNGFISLLSLSPDEVTLGVIHNGGEISFYDVAACMTKVNNHP
jgi:hypothetical protein